MVQDLIKQGLSMREIVAHLSESLGLETSVVEHKLKDARVQTFYYDFRKHEALKQQGVNAEDAVRCCISDGFGSNSIRLMLIQVYGLTWDSAASLEYVVRAKK